MLDDLELDDDLECEGRVCWMNLELDDDLEA